MEKRKKTEGDGTASVLKGMRKPHVLSRIVFERHRGAGLVGLFS